MSQSMVHKIWFRLLLLISLLFAASKLMAQNISGVVNAYIGVTAVGVNSATLTSIGPFQVGDKVLLIQMKGAAITSTNSAAFGSITALQNAGNFEFATIGSVNVNTVTFVNNLCKTYTPVGKVQLVRIPVYTNVNISGTVTALPWNGNIGGIVAIEATNSITFNANINVSGQGFVGGTFAVGGFNCGDPNYANQSAGKKGEGIAIAPLNMDANRAPLANGGGGSNTGNPGAGGGGNGGSGGRGGNEFYGWCGLNTSFGIGGYAPSYGGFKSFLGGGGGGGFKDNGLNATAGANGGGMVFLTSPTINGNNFTIDAKGADVIGNTDSEGAGAGGAGGCIYYLCPNTTSNVNLDLRGGNGGNIFSTIWASACHGPGGGGGGGAVAFQQAALPINVTNLLLGGASGMVLHNGPPCTGTSHGAMAGANGIQLFNYITPSAPVVPNLGPNLTLCAGQSATLVLSTAFNSYAWSTGQTSATISISSPGVYWVDVPSGCGVARDSIIINLSVFNFDVGPDLSMCQGDSVNIAGNGNFTTINWNNGVSNSFVVASSPGIYSATATNSLGCVETDSMVVTQINTTFTPVIDSICAGSTYNFNGQLLSFSGSYVDTLQSIQGCDSIVGLSLTLIQPISSFNNASICAGTVYAFNGLSLTQTGAYSTVIPSAYGCDSIVNLNLTVSPALVISVSDTMVCSNTALILGATGGQTYVWNVPQNQNGTINVAPLVTTSYQVYGIDQNGCVSSTVTLTVFIDPTPVPNFFINPIQVEMDNPVITIYNETSGTNESLWTILGSSFENNLSSFDYQLPYQEGSFNVQLISETSLGCKDSLTLTAIVLNNVGVYVPNAFTPDGEETNTVFLPVFSTGFIPMTYCLTIRNRWGEIIFSTQNTEIGWDGRFNYALCQDGVYNYHIIYQRQDGEAPVILMGHVNLLR